MSIRVALHHKTVYQYDRLVTLSPQTVRLRPAAHTRTKVNSYSLNVEPRDHFINWQQDPQGNFLARLTFLKPVNHFSITVDLTADMTVVNPFDFFLEAYAETFPFVYEPIQAKELAPYLEVAPAGPLLNEWLASVSRKPVHAITFLVELNRRLQQDIQYVIRMEPGVQTTEDTLALRSGSCRDTGWLMVEILRHLGLAARFVSGYLIQLKPDVKPIEGPEGPQDDFTDLHAWAEVFVPGAGWIGLDPTSGLLAGEGHIPLAASFTPQTAAPISGSVTECQVEFHHEMKVTRIHEDPRVTKPYTEDQWKSITVLGEQIDNELKAGDVRLTMGGEPTFVSIDDRDGDEWNYTAMGPLKLKLAGNLIHRLRQHFAPGGLLHFGQGKWYPGESLPRWAFSCYWRKDGVPLWHDVRWCADPDKDYGYGQVEAERFAHALAERLAVGPDHVIAAYEDPLNYIHKERQLPVNVDPVDNKLDDPEERENLRRVFSRGLGTPTGFVLPLARRSGKSGPEWQSGLWMLRSRHLFLIPGDSPVGFRLPIKSLKAEPADEVAKVWAIDPMAPLPPLSVPARAQSQPRITRTGDGAPAQRQNEQPQPDGAYDSGSVVRTALTVEARNGRIYLFMPPVASADDYADLVAAIEDTAAQVEMPVLIEGYTPPADPRLEQIKVTPDPGVIEVNVHPAHNWAELVANTTQLYEDARLSRLSTEKFMLDGRHTGTGGGNHIVLGAPTPADSPFLRRPDLLKSLVGFWLNHPALSYLFSSAFIGPTSQAPRVDETRADAVYELEIAFAQIKRPDGPVPPWLVDRIFRNLLVDVTGNTHRSEFCIDKLYSPDSSSGRLGLLEMRAFEMPPHARMSLTQQLLVRALVARFWREPYEEQPIRWGTRLHDLYLLPHYVERDMERVLEMLRTSGYEFSEEWFAPHFEFRFPVFGRVCHEGVEIELRQAIEPWYVLGEQPAGGATSRYVDSSVERLQVRVRGLTSGRMTVTCNGLRLPLQPTGVHGEFVAGVRYRAWQPPECLHPTIPVHTPLVFDLADLSLRRSLGGCTYHVGHPGGRNYDTFPVNSNEAEARRKARFIEQRYTPGHWSAPRVNINPEFPATLDLRWPGKSPIE